ncbi:hypothetical protein EJ04DRAFT_516995 [Polyplosphaeria fusca]|uniref:C3H1-type domain-containing protein n=1 Tax=Polyplosphaeria fusca TaxID=682080 RepID=A0A9P4QLX1_9PLEO|nr:hypothetical protein EJ04DRAFT_516995 [Polyplosphaeria fusca]
MSAGLFQNGSEAAGTAASNTTDDLWAKYGLITEHDNERTLFVQELLMRYDYLTEQWLKATTQIQQDKAKYAATKQREQELSDKVKALTDCLNRDPFILVLIDGDGMIFNDDLIRAGKSGGRDAAQILQKAILHDVQRDEFTVPRDARIVCRVYANVRGLAEVLVRTGVAEEISVFDHFVRGFTRGEALFDFVDVGPGKDRADQKIIETFKLCADNVHCRQIYFGCSHDNGYARTLERYLDPVYLKKVHLLEGVPLEKELLELPFKSKKLPSIFRETKLSVWSAQQQPGYAPVTKQYDMYSGLPTQFPAPPQSGFWNNPLPTHADTKLPRTSSSSTTASDAAPAPKLMSWAATAAAPPPMNPETPAYRPISRGAAGAATILRNRHGQRIDPPLATFDRNEIDYIKKLKLCNIHYLRNECFYQDKCSNRHDVALTPADLGNLRWITRMQPCKIGPACNDIKCIYGHRCQVPDAKTVIKGTKTCIYGPYCKFGPELHNIDCHVVKTLVLY